jgi:hypothetical protein
MKKLTFTKLRSDFDKIINSNGGSIMKKSFLFTLLAGFILLGNMTLFAQDTARLQVIHNAADPGAEMVDIYLNEKLLLDDFKFRAATEFIDAPAGEEFIIGVAPSTSTSADDALAKIPVTLEADKKYVAVANGVLDPTSFAANPNGISIGFELIAKDGAREEGMSMDKVDLRILHGATDAPAVDVLARGVGALVEGAPYAAMTDYISVPPAEYLLDVTPAGMNETVVATFQADLNGLGGGAAVVFASGFLNPANNMDGKAFGLFAALPTGDVVELPALTTARLQVIHNAADPGAEMVDIYVNEKLLLDDFKFRMATEYIDAPANTEIMIGVAPPSSNSVDDAIAKIPVTLMAGESYVAVANGVLDPTKFAENPDGRETAFQLLVKKGAREMAKPEMAAGEENVQFIVLHGATDAPAVDVIARDVAKLVEGAAYTDFTDYITVPAAKYTLDITPAGMNETIVASFKADLSGLAGGAAVVFASGFLNPANNMDGKAFGLFAALPNGNVVELMSPTFARLQVIHNAADPGAKMVDIYLNEKLLLDDFMFRAATPYIDAPADEKFMIGVAPSTSSSVDDAIAQIPVTLESGETYVAVANGVLDPTKFAENPDGKETAFQLLVKKGTREMGTSEDNVDFVVLHGATDAPGVDVIARDVATLVEGAQYSMITDYISVPVNNYILDITPAGDNSTIVASFEAPLEGLGGGAAVVFASGFLAPENNMNGMAFGLYAALPNGDVLELPAADITSVFEDAPVVVTEYELQQNYPNPFNPTTTISFAIPEPSNVKVIVYDMLGKEVATLVNEERASGAYNVVWNGLDESGFQVASGVYFYALETQNFTQIRRMMLVK